MAYYDLGDILFKLGKYDEAKTVFIKAIVLNPNYVDAYNAYGNAEYRLGLYENARDFFIKVIELDSNYINVYYNLGLSYKGLGNFDLAIYSLTKAIKLFPDFSDAYHNRGITYYYLGSYLNAIQDYSKVIELKPDDKDAYYNRGIAKFYLGLHQEALQDYNKAIELDTNFEDAYYNRGLAKQKLGLSKEALIDINKAYELNSKNIQVRTALNNLKDQMVDNPVTKPKIWAVVVGLSVYKYEKIMTPLNSPVKNVYDFVRFMESINFIKEKIPVLINSSANKDSILQTIKSIFLDKNKVNENDMIIFYYSGHGEAVGNQSGICPYEYVYPEQLITDQEILDILQKSPAHHKVCIIEACKTETEVMSPISEASFDQFNDERLKIPGSIVYITSTKVGEKSIEAPQIGAVFSHYFLQGITEGKADSNNDGIIRVKELFNYVKDNVSRDTRNTQIPQINQEGYESDIPVLVYK